MIPKLEVDVPAAFDSLVDAGTFASVQERLNGGAPRHQSGDELFPLRRFAYWAECTTPYTRAFTRSKGRTYGYYRCRRCKRSNVRRRMLHEAFVAQLDLLSLDRRMVPMFREVALTAFREERNQRAVGVRRFSRELVELGGQERALHQAFIYEQRIGADVYDEELSRIRKRRSGLERELHGFREPAMEPEFVLSRAEAVVTNPGDTWKRLESLPKRAFQRIVFPDGVPIRGGECLEPHNSPIFNVLRAVRRGEVTNGGADGI